MASYIGRTPAVGNFQKCDAISVVNGQATYGLTVNSVAVYPESSNHVLCSLNGILQAPQDSFTISSSNIVFASNLATGDVIDFVMILGNVLDLGVPSDNTVSLAKLTATGTKSSSTFLRGDNTFAEVVSGLTMADQWRMTADNNTNGDITSNLEQVDTAGQGTLGTAMTQSSGIFTFPSTGIYLVKFNVNLAINNGGVTFRIILTVDNSTYNTIATAGVGLGIDQDQSGEISTLIDVTDTSNVKVKFNFNNFTNTTARGDTTRNKTFFTFLRLGDT